MLLLVIKLIDLATKPTRAIVSSCHVMPSANPKSNLLGRQNHAQLAASRQSKINLLAARATSEVGCLCWLGSEVSQEHNRAEIQVAKEIPLKDILYS
jgi:hypothetical protein